ncbi:hypothetical protein [Bradyrhizobium sp. BWC-3-1]|uniref:hypothetical protein n=1 Tax=Bradyrhizobium sp. BWC-3-1 TaxID=3080012 RepID=UPI00293F751E|nr:hypothetical protein [Bradyrhizobium sp. BWC-3-1]WOH54894.1 hypothetical protein RX329_21415 [Bradyrhizobium sp. BWC-3-1]
MRLSIPARPAVLNALLPGDFFQRENGESGIVVGTGTAERAAIIFPAKGSLQSVHLHHPGTSSGREVISFSNAVLKLDDLSSGNDEDLDRGALLLDANGEAFIRVFDNLSDHTFKLSDGQRTQPSSGPTMIFPTWGVYSASEGEEPKLIFEWSARRG